MSNRIRRRTARATCRRLPATLLPAVVTAMIVAACGGSSNSAASASATGKTAASFTTGTATSSTTASTASGTATSTTTGTTTTGTTKAKTTTGKTRTTVKKTSTQGTGSGSGASSNGGSGLSAGASLSDCDASDLVARELGSQGASGTEVLVYSLADTGTSSCEIKGWPGIVFLQRDGQPTPTTPARVTADAAGSTGKPKQIKLAPGNEVSFRVIVTESASGGGGSCINAATIEITPPSGSASIKLPLKPALPTCGRATVSPILTGTTAEP